MKSPHSRKSNAIPKRVSRQHPRTFWQISKFGRNGWVRGYYEGSIRVYEENTCLKLAAVKGLPTVGIEFQIVPVTAMMNLSKAKGTWIVSSFALVEEGPERRGLVSFGSSLVILIRISECKFNLAKPWVGREHKQGERLEWPLVSPDIAKTTYSRPWQDVPALAVSCRR